MAAKPSKSTTTIAAWSNPAAKRKEKEDAEKAQKDAEKEAIEKVNVQGVEHITASISQLVEAINHAKMGHADVAIKHIDEAPATQKLKEKNARTCYIC